MVLPTTRVGRQQGSHSIKITRAKVQVVLFISFSLPLTIATDLLGDDHTRPDSLIRTSRAAQASPSRPSAIACTPKFPINTVVRDI